MHAIVSSLSILGSRKSPASFQDSPIILLTPLIPYQVPPPPPHLPVTRSTCLEFDLSALSAYFRRFPTKFRSVTKLLARMTTGILPPAPLFAAQTELLWLRPMDSPLLLMAVTRDREPVGDLILGSQGVEDLPPIARTRQGLFISCDEHGVPRTSQHHIIAID